MNTMHVAHEWIVFTISLQANIFPRILISNVLNLFYLDMTLICLNFSYRTIRYKKWSFYIQNNNRFLDSAFHSREPNWYVSYFFMFYFPVGKHIEIFLLLSQSGNSYLNLMVIFSFTFIFNFYFSWGCWRLFLQMFFLFLSVNICRFSLICQTSLSNLSVYNFLLVMLL